MSHPRMLPDGKITIKPRPAIRSIAMHTECWRLKEFEVFSWHGFPGDLKRCPHGKIMVRRQAGPYARIAGPGTDYWSTLSPIWHPLRYRRARKALAHADVRMNP